MIGFEDLHKELLRRKSEDYNRYKDYSESDLAFDLVRLRFYNVEDIDWTIFYPLYLIIERTENPRTEICKGIQVESFVKKLYGFNRKYLLLQFRDNARHYIPQCFQSAVLSDFENESSRLLFECKDTGDYEGDGIFDIMFDIVQKHKIYNDLTREEWYRIEVMRNKLEGIARKLEMMRSENLSYRKRIEELEAQQLLSPGITVDQICKYAKEYLDKNERQTISHMLLNIIQNPDKETRAKIKALDKKTPLDAQKVVLGDDVQTKIVKS